jgi:hypothetical protein
MTKEELNHIIIANRNLEIEYLRTEFNNLKLAIDDFMTWSTEDREDSIRMRNMYNKLLLENDK